jgi:hypothetical protein
MWWDTLNITTNSVNMHSHVTYTNILVCIHRTWNNQNITEDQSGGWGGRKKKKKGEGKEM